MRVKDYLKMVESDENIRTSIYVDIESPDFLIADDCETGNFEINNSNYIVFDDLLVKNIKHNIKLTKFGAYLNIILVTY